MGTASIESHAIVLMAVAGCFWLPPLQSIPPFLSFWLQPQLCLLQALGSNSLTPVTRDGAGSLGAGHTQDRLCQQHHTGPCGLFHCLPSGLRDSLLILLLGSQAVLALVPLEAELRLPCWAVHEDSRVTRFGRTEALLYLATNHL